MANPQKGTELWQEIATVLNDIIVNTGKKIDINNKTIWDGYLHRWTNQDWLDILAAYAQALDEDPRLALPYRQRNLQAARAKIMSSKTGTRALDRKSTGGKRIAWAMINTLRETWNDIQGTVIPNEDRPQPKAKRRGYDIESTEEYTRITIWHNLFEVN
jgi:hypothetical protein